MSENPPAQGSSDRGDSWSANQGKSEPVPPTPGHADPDSPVEEPADMTVGAGDPQAPSHAAAADRGQGSSERGSGHAPGVDLPGEQAAPGTLEDAPVARGVRTHRD